MKQILSFFILFIFVSGVVPAQELKLPRVSQKASVTQTVGLTDITITYSRPGVKGRPIWGGLVPYDQVWRTGANEATTITFSDDVRIEGQTLAAGTYSLHTIPGKTEWIIIFNKEANQWGSYRYDATKDALRIKVIPVEGPHQEWMEFSFPDIQQDSAVIQLSWEKLRIPFRIQTNTVEKALKNIQEALDRMKDWRIPYRAADFASNAGRTSEAKEWIEQSVALKETYWNLRLKANLLAEGGKIQEAIATAEKAVKIGKQNGDEPTEIEKTQKWIDEWKSQSTSKK